MSVTLSTGITNRVIGANTGLGTWTVDTAANVTGFSILQYDGKDASPNRNNNGLGGIDLTDGGLAKAFRTSIRSDLPTSYVFSVYSPNGGVCSSTVNVQSSTFTDFTINFSSFSTGCSFSSVGAIEVRANQGDNVDAVMRELFTIGDPDPSTPSRTRTPSPLVSQSRTRTPSPAPPAPSGTRTPTPTPTTNCMCHCPAFTCELIFDPDDDENNVYYFDDDDGTGGNDGDGNGGDGGNGGNSGGDGGNSGGNSGGNGGNSGGNDDSSASVISMSVTLFAVVLLALF